MIDVFPFHNYGTLLRWRDERDAEIDRLLKQAASVKRIRDEIDGSIRHREANDAVLGKRVGRTLTMEGG